MWRRALLTIMSTYIDVAHPNRHAPYTDIPDLVMDYLHYLDVVKLRSPRTINGYYLDLRGFFRYMMMVWNLAQPDTPPEEIDLTHITKRQISTITKRDITWITPAVMITVPRPVLAS